MASGETPGYSQMVLPKPIPDLAEEEFYLFQVLVLRESGIHLGAKNRAMLVSRLWKRLRALELKSLLPARESRSRRNGADARLYLHQ